ncbi:MAG: PHP domain-containing protein [Pseudomonadota bacterium]
MVPLTVRSYYSLMWGTCSPQALCTAAGQRGYNRLALTDTDNLYGLWPFLKSCRRNGITPIIGAELTDPGQTHRAVSLVAYSLGITNVCPVKHNLYFERFLNPGRSDPPDIDIDFAWDERDNVLHSVLARYDGHAALVCNHVAFQPRMAIREAAKVYGLADTAGRIVAGRKAGPYRSIADFIERVRPDEREARALIFAGAFDGLYPQSSRAELLWELACRHKSGSNGPMQESLFSSGPDVPRPLFPPENELERRRHEFAALGFLCDRHPMELFADTLKNLQIVKAADLPGFVGKHVRIAGLLITGKVVHTKRGEPMEFLTFEDETGLVETTFFPQAYRRFCALLDHGRPFILYGRVQEEFGAVTLSVERVDRIGKVNA